MFCKFKASSQKAAKKSPSKLDNGLTETIAKVLQGNALKYISLLELGERLNGAHCDQARSASGGRRELWEKAALKYSESQIKGD